ncbi:FecCD family ABC transporter permease [Natrarchaeobius sp. A-rgal3]|uniref:FecCD family ABC transporter permease n=1 Tax=Natrarchaeobius versutus TaxID=1679078 RepID=UPI00350F2304
MDTAHAEIINEYRRSTSRKLAYLGGFAILTVATGLAALSAGAADISLPEALFAVLERYIPVQSGLSETRAEIAVTLRLPRVVMALVAGASLAMAGVLLQAILKNPLASPFTLGIGSAASFGASLAIILGVTVVGMTGAPSRWFVAVNAFVMSLVPAFVIFGLVRYRSASPATMILAGIAMTYFFSASTSLLQYVGSEEAIAATVFWMFGSLEAVTWSQVLIVIAVAAPLTLIAYRLSWDLNALLQGGDVARSLGVDTFRIRVLGMIVAALVTGVTIAFLGTIGFIGLVAPHIARMLIGGDHRYLIPASLFLGGILLAGADAVSRTVISPEVIPVGIMTAFLGVPFFFYLIVRRNREHW